MNPMSKRLLITVSAVLLGTTLVASGCENAGKADKKTDLHSAAHMNNTDHDHEAMIPGESADGIAQKTCPVMGNPVNKNLFVDYNGKRIYVCCDMCIDQVNKDPEKYIRKLAELGEEPGVVE
jgi:YHS domain-containing protein/outer membrane murein-binding lipoprotein Lpp